MSSSEASEKKECVLKANLQSDSFTVQNPAAPVRLGIIVEGDYSITHSDGVKQGPVPVKTTIPYDVKDHTAETITEIIIQNLQRQAIAKIEAALQNGLKKICEKHGCQKEGDDQ